MSRLGRLLKATLVVAAAAVLALAAWIAFTVHARVERERLAPQAIAPGLGRWVDTGDASVHLQSWGDPTAPTVVLVHGTGAWSGTWFSLPAALVAAGWQVVALDLPPFGLSTVTAPGPAAYTRAAQARRILAVLAGLNQPVALVGHSFGAGPALEAALMSPPDGGFVRQLVLVDAALGLGPAGQPPRCEAPAADSLFARRGLRTTVIGATATWPGFTGALLKRFVHRTAVVDERLLPAYRVPFARIGYSADLGDWAWAFAGGACEQAASLRPSALRAWDEGVGVPVALIWGARDAVTPLPQARALQAWMPHAGLEVIPDVGHIPHIEDPAAFAAALLRVLQRPVVLASAQRG
jgi:pimeloyl-ACP methyl ester carboxylesterase